MTSKAELILYLIRAGKVIADIKGYDTKELEDMEARVQEYVVHGEKDNTG